MDAMKKVMLGLLCGLSCGTFLVQTAHVLPVSLVIGDLEQRPRQVRAAVPEDFRFGCPPIVPSLDIKSETPRSDFYWSYLAMA